MAGKLGDSNNSKENDKSEKDINDVIDTLKTGKDIKSDDANSSTFKMSDELISKLRDEPYIKNYNHQEKSKLFPVRIVALQVNELYDLIRQAEFEIKTKTLSANDEDITDNTVKFFQDLISFTNKVIDDKKNQVKVKENTIKFKTEPMIKITSGVVDYKKFAPKKP